MFKNSLLTIGMVAAMSLSMSGAFAQNFDHRDGYRNEHRDMRGDRREFRNERFDHRDMRGDRGNYGRGGHGNFERGGHGSWQGGHQNHFAMNNHNFAGGHRGRR